VGRPNVIFVIVDALRNDMISFAGAFAPPTPNIDRLASAGVFFHDAYSCTNATDSSVTCMMTGLSSRGCEPWIIYRDSILKTWLLPAIR
jgi:arylsulfatase A-like enzyme